MHFLNGMYEFVMHWNQVCCDLHNMMAGYQRDAVNRLNKLHERPYRLYYYLFIYFTRFRLFVFDNHILMD